MKLYDIIAEEKTRLDPACWTGKKIGNPKTKVKGGVRVNNCVPAESVAEGKTIASGLNDWQKKALNHDTYEKYVSHCNRYDYPHMDKRAWQRYKNAFDNMGTQGVAEDSAADGSVNYTLGHTPDAEYVYSIYRDGKKEGTYHSVDQAKRIVANMKKSAPYIKYKITRSPRSKMAGPKGQLPEQGVAEGFNGEYDDEAGMADNNLETLRRAVDGIDNVINTGDNLPEWCQEKIAVAKSMLVTVWDYMRSEEQIEDPEIAEMYEAMQLMAESMAHKHRVSVDLVWESFEALDDHMLYETAAWRRKEGKSAKGGLNAKGVASYRRENPGSKLQTAVTTKPSKLKPGSKAAKRRKSFCARMSGVKGPAKKPNGKPTRKTLALRKWNC